jgi:hypothetical protein
VLGIHSPSVRTLALVGSGALGPLGLVVRSSGGDVRGISNSAILAPAVVIVERGWVGSRRWGRIE